MKVVNLLKEAASVRMSLLAAAVVMAAGGVYSLKKLCILVDPSYRSKRPPRSVDSWSIKYLSTQPDCSLRKNAHI